MSNAGEILIVDDEEKLRGSLKKMLEMDGFQVITAGNGQEGLELLHSHSIDIAIIDLVMPGTDGMWLINKVNESNLNPGLIVVTGYGTLEIAVKSMKMGVWEFIQKPVDYEMMNIAIMRSLEKLSLLRNKKEAENKIKLQNEELVVANSKLKELDQLKSKFLSKAAHELRSPLTVLTCSLEIMRDDLSNDNLTALERHLNSSINFTINMSNIVSEMLDLNMIMSDNIKVEMENSDLGELLTETASTAKALLDKNGIALNIDIAEDRETLYFSNVRISQVVVNLITNAVKFTPKGGMIETILKDCEHDAIVTIKDTGCGIPVEDVPYIFDEFYQVKNEEKKGAGLGLSICKKIIEAHHGKIWAVSVPGQGTEVSFSLPK